METNELIQSHRIVTIGSERNFGIIFSIVFAVVGLGRIYHHGPIRWWAIAFATAFLVCGFAAPWLLRPLNQLWFKFGLLLHHVVNPVVMGLIYFGALVPTGLVLRAQAKDLLRLKFDKTAASYWIPREVPAPRPGGMTKQF